MSKLVCPKCDKLTEISEQKKKGNYIIICDNCDAKLRYKKVGRGYELVISEKERDDIGSRNKAL